MAATQQATVMLALIFRTCEHISEKKKMLCVEKRRQLISIFEEEHGLLPKSCTLTTLCQTALSPTNEKFETTANVTVGDVTDSFRVKLIEFECKRQQEESTTINEIVSRAADAATTKAVDAFQILMARGRAFPSKKTSSAGLSGSVNRKDELFNDLLDKYFIRNSLNFPRALAKDEGTYFVQVLCNALWFITNQHNTLNDAALKQKDLQPVPAAFDEYTGYNEVRRKKLKSQPMNVAELESHSQALYSLLLRPVMKSTENWAKSFEDIKSLADCLNAYKKYLQSQLTKQQVYHGLDHPVRTVAEFTTVEHRHALKDKDVKDQYKLLDTAVVSAGLNNYVLFDEDKHIESHFESNLQRFRYMQGLQLSVPIDIFRFCPGGSIITCACVVHVQENRSDPELLTQSARLVCQLKSVFREYHTRAQKKIFKDRLSNVASVLPSVADLIYKELSMDQAAVSHPDTHERLRLVFLGEEGLLTDLRHLNTGRPTGRYDMFFENLSGIIEEVTAADERRHNLAHLSEWISLSDLIDAAQKKCPENTPVPSKSLVRLQFAPRNPYVKTALSFTSRLNIQYKIQRRQLRVAHPDQHYCAAILKYIKEKAVELQNKCILVCCDDKAKVSVGEPGFAVSTGVRGKKTIAPTSTTLCAADHDMNKSSLTPSVILQVDIPTSVEQSFVRGLTTVIVNDSVLQSSNPFRHAASLIKTIPADAGKILILYTDGGTDHRNTLESVQCSAICLFKEMDLDMVILARCAPGHSWQNPAERVMSILNLGLQNCALERKQCDKNIEDILKSCGSMKDIREKASKNEDVKNAWTESVESVQSLVRNRFLRLKLKDRPFQSHDPVPDNEIDILKRHLRELFPSLDLNNLVKASTKKCESYKTWKESHCRERQYIFQIKKCGNPDCCIPPTSDVDDLNWLPDPVLTDNEEHYKKYKDIKSVDTTEEDRPTLKKTLPTLKKTRTTQAPPKSTPEDTERNTGEAVTVTESSSFFTAQNSRATIVCTECSKPRIIYGKTRLNQRQQVLLAVLMSEFDYTCGAPLTPPGSPLYGKFMCRSNIFCNSPIEVSYYSCDLEIAKDICAYCGSPEATKDLELKKKYKTVHPMCQICGASGKTPIVYRPYGKQAF